MMETTCRLCSSARVRLMFEGDRRSHLREFWHCAVCDMVSVPDRFLVSAADEIQRYTEHENEPSDTGYREFLSGLVDEIVPRVPPGSKGLDFGCGETAVVALLLEEAGHHMSRYDLYFRDELPSLATTYDFIACSETVEHFREPLAEFETFAQILRPGGLAGVMTGMLDDWAEFPDWHYHYDATHICYYSKRTMQWLAERFGWTVSFPRQNVTILETA